MSASDRDRWNARYRYDEHRVQEPDTYLVSLDEVLPRQGRALDVAGGTGRHAIWLARRGLDVTVIDIADVGLELATARAASAGVAVHTYALDLEHEPLPEGPWDVIVDFHYLHRPLFSRFAQILVPGGLLVFVQPTMSNLQRHPRPSAQYLLQDGELPELITNLDDPGLEMIEYREDWSPAGRHEARLLARRPLRSPTG